MVPARRTSRGGHRAARHVGEDSPPRGARAAAACTVSRIRFAMPGGSRGGETTTYCLLGMQAANGAAVIDGGEVVIDSPETVECLAFLSELAGAGVLWIDAVSYEYDRAPRMLARGQAVFSIGGSYELRTLAAEAGLDVEGVWEHFGFVLPPRGGRRGGDWPVGWSSAVSGKRAIRIWPCGCCSSCRRRRPWPGWATDRAARLPPVRGRAGVGRLGLPLHDSGHARRGGRAAGWAGPKVSVQLQAMLEAVLVGRLDATSCRPSSRRADLCDHRHAACRDGRCLTGRCWSANPDPAH